MFRKAPEVGNIIRIFLQTKLQGKLTLYRVGQGILLELNPNILVWDEERMGRMFTMLNLAEQKRILFS